MFKAINAGQDGAWRRLSQFTVCARTSRSAIYAMCRSLKQLATELADCKWLRSVPQSLAQVCHFPVLFWPCRAANPHGYGASWKNVLLLASRIDALKRGQEALQLAPVPEAVEAMAQCCAAQLITRQTKPMLGKLSAVQLMARSLQADAAAAAATGLTCEDDRHSTIAAKQPPVVACPSRATS